MAIEGDDAEGKKMKVDLGAARLVTVRELSRDTAGVLRDVNETREPVIITKHGRLVAILAPLTDAKLELKALEAGSSAFPDPEELDNEMVASESESLDEVRASLRKDQEEGKGQ